MNSDQSSRPPIGYRLFVNVITGIACTFVALLVFTLLMPAGWPPQARHGARTAYCQSDLKQISAALRMYAEDNDNALPIADAWQTAALAVRAKPPWAPLNEGVFHCPEDERNAPSSYALNEECGGRGITNFADAAAAPLVYDSWLERPNGHDRLESFARRHEWKGEKHLGNVAFADGHVKTVKQPPRATDGIATDRGP